jgi:hypothetical protein
MIPDVSEVWSKSVNASEFFNVERKASAGPDSGGGQLYFQVPVKRVEDTLQFLRTTYDQLPTTLSIRNIGSEVEQSLTFFNKSAGRMRTGPQNRQRGQRIDAWTPQYGFPRLSDNVEAREEAEELIEAIGGLHIFLARTVEDVIWAGFTTGSHPPKGWPDFEFNNLLFGIDEPGGYWKST